MEALLNSLLEGHLPAALPADPDERARLAAWARAELHQSWPADPPRAYALADLLRLLAPRPDWGPQPGAASDAVARLAEKARREGAAFDSRPLESLLARDLVAYLKKQVDAYRWQDNERAIACARAIIQIGEQRANPADAALGWMTLGDAIAPLGDRLEEAFGYMRRAAASYLALGDLVGWARCCIGQVSICAELDRVEETLAEAELAADIFDRFDEPDLQVRLAVNRLRIEYEIGRYAAAIATFEKIRPVALSLGESGEPLLGYLYNNIGLTYLYQGNLHAARGYFEQAEEVLARLNKHEARLVVLQNIATIEQFHGHFGRALKLLHEVLDGFGERRSIYVAHVKMYIIECYLQLNRNEEALARARENLADLAALQAAFTSETAQTYRYIGLAQGRLGRPEEARLSLEQARALFEAHGSETWAQIAALLLGELALDQGDFKTADQAAGTTLPYFAAHDQTASLARAALLKGRAEQGLNQLQPALESGRLALANSRRSHSNPLRYKAHLLLGELEEGRGRPHRARRHYQAALAAVRRQQKDLTITLSPDFLEDKSGPLHALLRLELAAGRAESAFAALERYKSQILLTHLTNRERLVWPQEDGAARALSAELTRLREEHRLLYRLSSEARLPGQEEPQIDPSEAGRRLQACEKRMRAVTEQLYLRSMGDGGSHPAPNPTLAEIQRGLRPGDRLLEYVTDGDRIWLFVVDPDRIEVLQLPGRIETVQPLVENLYFNLQFALQLGVEEAASAGLSREAMGLGQALYDALLAPAAPHIAAAERLVVVPYGLLHYLPFNLLHDGKRYLIERHELLLLPAAGLLTRPAPTRPPGALILAHSAGGRLPQVEREAAALQDILPGRLYVEEDAGRGRLAAPPVQILHIAAHGEHRLDRPDLSYIQLADGQLYGDDLLQHDLSYELVVLSACETGQAAVRRGEELIGLGRGVLNAGAGALLASLWPVDDRATAGWMPLFYRGLEAGRSKAAALRAVQQHILAGDPGRHPAFWGAFQLIGDAGPLSGGREGAPPALA